MQSTLSKETKLDKHPLRLLFLLSRFLDGALTPFSWNMSTTWPTIYTTMSP